MGQRTTETDADGRWTFSNVMEGSYTVTALVPTSPPTRIAGEESPDREQLFRESRQRFLMTHQDIALAGADVAGVTMAISGPGSLVGRVETDNGAALPANLVIFLEVISKGTRPGPPLPVRVSPGGTFILGRVPGGEVYVAVALPPDSKFFVKSISANGTDLRSGLLTILEDAQAGPVQVVISQGVGTLTGRVLSEKNQGLADIVVLLVPVASERQRFRTAYLTARTGPDGGYSVSGAPGVYFVFARRREELPPVVTEEFIKNQAANTRRVVIASGEQKLLDLRAK